MSITLKPTIHCGNQSGVIYHRVNSHMTHPLLLSIIDCNVRKQENYEGFRVTLPHHDRNFVPLTQYPSDMTVVYPTIGSTQDENWYLDVTDGKGKTN